MTEQGCITKFSKAKNNFGMTRLKTCIKIKQNNNIVYLEKSQLKRLSDMFEAYDLELDKT